MIIDSIREYMKECPQLADGKMNINCLGGDFGCYSIDNVAAEPVIKRYCDGGSLRQFVFVLALRDAYDEDVSQNLRIAMLFEQIGNWISERNSGEILPKIEDAHIKPQSIEVLKSGFLYDSQMSSGRWQMELRMIYRQDC